MAKPFEIFIKGVIKNNPTFVLILGMCPTLATSTSLENALGMGIATLLVLIFSSLIVSLIKKYVSYEIRVPAFIVVIASLVTIINLLMNAYLPELYKRLGIYMPLIVVNCIVLGRALAFAYRNPVIDSAIDGFSTGLGFTLALALIGAIREILGNGSIKFMGKTFVLGVMPMNIFITPPGALLTIGLLLGLFNYIKNTIKKVEG